MSSQWKLLKQNNFGPLFWTQFLGAFNDNLFKNALVILLTFRSGMLPGSITGAMASNISAGIFILPFFLFSAWAGDIADQHEKSKLIRILKVWEIMIISLGIAGLALSNIYLLWATLFGLGVQATFFGPLKYSILPQHLAQTELVGGNALIESGTFIAILIGTILGGVLIEKNHGWLMVGIMAWLVALSGYLSARKIPLASSSGNLNMSWNIFKQTADTINIARQNRTVFLSILGISWFWFFGATLLSQFPSLVKDVLGGNESIVTLLLAIFSIGIAIGSLLCEKMSGHKVEIGLVPFGAIGLSLFAFDFYFALHHFQKGHDLSISQFWLATGSWRIIIDLIGLSLFAGFFMVPLYALIQSRSEDRVRSRIIAANNIMNALFMVAAAGFAIALFAMHFTIAQLVLSLAILNTLTAVYIFTLVPEFLVRFLVWILIHTLYKVKKTGLENVPEDGAALLICNHVSFIDALIIFGSIRRPVRFVMYYRIYNLPVLKWLFNAVGAIPIASKNEAPEVLAQAYEKIQTYLNEGEVVVIFPEGTITRSGEMGEFKAGVLKILEQTPVSVIPSGLTGLWGSMFSRKENSLWRYIPRGFFTTRIGFNVGQPLTPEMVTQESMKSSVDKLTRICDCA